MATRKLLKDYDGNVVQIGDVVYYRDLECQREFYLTGKVISIRDDMRDDEVYLLVKSGDGSERHKLLYNVKKMNDNEAMLWKLENL